MFYKTTFKQKTVKRDIEDQLTEFKKQHLMTNGARAISLTGPNVEDHVLNYFDLGIYNVVILEKDRPTFLSMQQDPFVQTHPTNISLFHGDIWKFLINNPTINFSDFDFDFTKTIKTLYPTIQKNFYNAVTSYNTDFFFTVTFTFCSRQNRREKFTYLDGLYSFLHQSNWFNIKKIYLKEYKDLRGAPMFTTLLLLKKNTLGWYEPLPKIMFF